MNSAKQLIFIYFIFGFLNFFLSLREKDKKMLIFIPKSIYNIIFWFLTLPKRITLIIDEEDNK